MKKSFVFTLLTIGTAVLFFNLGFFAQSLLPENQNESSSPDASADIPSASQSASITPDAPADNHNEYELLSYDNYTDLCEYLHENFRIEGFVPTSPVLIYTLTKVDPSTTFDGKEHLTLDGTADSRTTQTYIELANSDGTEHFFVGIMFASDYGTSDVLGSIGFPKGNSDERFSINSLLYKNIIIWSFNSTTEADIYTKIEQDSRLVDAIKTWENDRR